MQKSAKLFGAIFAGFGVFGFVCAAFAADATPRSAMDVRTINRATTGAARMPSMPVMTVNPVNITVDLPSGNTQSQPQPQPKPEPDPEPQPTPECPDGGVRNSEYGIQNCMNDVLACINNGALSGGLNDLFNEDMRNAIMNGMGLCSIQVEKCMSDVRRDCRPVYRSISDVWVDFNSRKIQPEYYNFVLRKTGLTPNQAENTCLLLDVNTYGPSFAAVDNGGITTAEYNNRVGAYNNQSGGVLIKTNPQGAQLNYGNPGVDGARGHYARWDATTATCYLRVAAYNKDSQIKNSWLFGAIGNDEPAEVWRAAGETFSCNKDLFGFGLMNDTKTAAVVGVGGGTLTGAGIGALAGHGKRAFDCGNTSARKAMSDALRNSGDDIYLLNAYLAAGQENVNVIKGADITEDQCKAIVDLYTNYATVQKGYDACSGVPFIDVDEETGETIESGVVGCDMQDLRSRFSLFSTLKCSEPDNSCITEDVLNKELTELKRLFGAVEKNGENLASLITNGEGSNIAKSMGTGAAIGAGTGGVATAITAFVERGNINCRVGDGLNTVAFGKSHSIDTLKDFYVKWNLRLPDAVAPTETAVDCKSWKLACAQYTDLNQCKAAALNYKQALDGTITLVRSACDVSGSVCIENAAVAKSYGACE